MVDHGPEQLWGLLEVQRDVEFVPDLPLYAGEQLLPDLLPGDVSESLRPRQLHGVAWLGVTSRPVHLAALLTSSSEMSASVKKIFFNMKK